MRADLLVRSLERLYTMAPDAHNLGEIVDGAIAFRRCTVCYIGPSSSAPPADVVINGTGLVGLPGLVDCHTHAVWAGSRADEFRRRLDGTPYTQILKEGGGILSTVRATRDAPEAELIALARARLRRLRRRGVTTAEIKSGYGLSPEAEARLLRAARRAGAGLLRVSPTFLGAHAIPPEWRHDRAGYVRQIITEQLPLCAPLAESIDAYCDDGAFTVEETLAILAAGAALGLKVRVHAEQVAHTGIARRAAAELGAVSADHLERLDDDGIAAMAAAGTVAVMLPAAQLYLRDTAPPTAKLRAAGVPMAVASDLNPGSSPVHDLWACATLACLLQNLTVEEAALGITRHAGQALGRADLGWLGESGRSVADLILVAPPPGEAPTLAGLVQHLGGPEVRTVIQGGQITLHDGNEIEA